MLMARCVPENLHKNNLLNLQIFYANKPDEGVSRLDGEPQSGYFLPMSVAREYAGG
jgi:hypothetical protein